MWPGSSILIVINALIFLVHSLPPNIDWNTLRNDLDPVAQNERILKLFLQLAVHAANRLTQLRKETDKGYGYNKCSDNPLISTTEALITQSLPQADLEQLDKNKKILNHSASSNHTSDFEINANQSQTVSYQELFDPTNVQDIGDQKNVTGSLNSKESTFGISQRLFGTDLAQIVPKIVSDVRENTNQHISQNTRSTREPSDRIDDISQRFLDPIIIKNSGNILNPQAADNLPVVNQILSSTKNIVESMFKILPDAAKSAGNFLNQIIPRPQDIISRPLKVAGESQKSLAHSDYTQQELSKKQTENQFDNLLHNRQDVTSNAENKIHEAANALGKNNQETTANNLSINDDNSTAENNNKQYVPTLLKNSSIPLLRLLLDFNEYNNNNNKNETVLSSIQTNDNANNFTKKQSKDLNDKKIDQHLDQIDKEIKTEGFKKMNEIKMDYIDKQLNPISEELSWKSKESELADIAVPTSTSPDQLESSTLTLATIMKHQSTSSSAQDSENVNDVVKSDLEEIRKLQDNSFANDDGINRSIEDQVVHIDNLLKSNSSLFDDLRGENLYEQLSEAKLQKISERLINALWLIIEKKMNNNRSYMTDRYNKQWNKNLLSHVSDSRQIYALQDSNPIKNRDQVEDATSHS